METAQTIMVKAKVVGQSKPPFPDWSVPLPPELWASEQMTLRDLITRIVLEEVEAFHHRREERRLTRVLSSAEMAQAAARGKISMSAQDSTQVEQRAEPDVAVAAALQAFEDRLYYVFVDDAQGEWLDQPVRLRPGSSVTFLRLVPLVGG
ncbi:MAG TPA: hypothetical protein VF826_18050 [Chloroflexia bacterium]|jgi:hypothetical protein